MREGNESALHEVALRLEVIQAPDDAEHGVREESRERLVEDLDLVGVESEPDHLDDGQVLRVVEVQADRLVMPFVRDVLAAHFVAHGEDDGAVFHEVGTGVEECVADAASEEELEGPAFFVDHQAFVESLIVDVLTAEMDADQTLGVEDQDQIAIIGQLGADDAGCTGESRLERKAGDYRPGFEDHGLSAQRGERCSGKGWLDASWGSRCG